MSRRPKPTRPRSSASTSRRQTGGGGERARATVGVSTAVPPLMRRLLVGAMRDESERKKQSERQSMEPTLKLAAFWSAAVDAYRWIRRRILDRGKKEYDVLRRATWRWFAMRGLCGQARGDRGWQRNARVIEVRPTNPERAAALGQPRPRRAAGN
jgi:hypothetical protein